MDGVLSGNDQQRLVSSFLEVAQGQTAETARQFLEATSWRLEESLELFLIEGGVELPPSTAETESSRRDNLDRHLVFNGSFDNAKGAASVQDKWLLVNYIQSSTSSDMLNQDTWGNEAVSQIISTNFIFWQVYDDTTEGKKVSTYYKLDDYSIPINIVLIIDPITGTKMHSWSGIMVEVEPQGLLEGLLPFLDAGPKGYHYHHSSPPKEAKVEDEEVQRALVASLESMMMEETTLPKRPTIFPTLPQEPYKVERNLLCRVGVRLPDVLRTDPIQLLWSFTSAQLGEDQTKLFRLTQAIPGASKNLDYETNSTFEESGLANSMISLTWDD